MREAHSASTSVATSIMTEEAEVHHGSAGNRVDKTVADNGEKPGGHPRQPKSPVPEDVGRTREAILRM